MRVLKRNQNHAYDKKGQVNTLNRRVRAAFNFINQLLGIAA